MAADKNSAGRRGGIRAADIIYLLFLADVKFNKNSAHIFYTRRMKNKRYLRTANTRGNIAARGAPPRDICNNIFVIIRCIPFEVFYDDVSLALAELSREDAAPRELFYPR